MHFSNKKFEQVYLSIISEQTEENTQFKYICKSCNTGFTEEDGFVAGDDCPVQDCDGKLEDFIADDLDPNNMPVAYEAEETDDELIEQCGDKDIIDEDEEIVDKDEDKSEDELLNECGDNEIIDEDENEDGTEFQDEDMDDDAAEEDDDNDNDEADDEKSDESDESEEDDGTAKLISFTSDNAELIELLTQVQNGELKLVAVPIDFEFEEDEMNEQPVLDAETMNNFDIEDIDDQEDVESQEQEEENDDADDESEETEETEESEEIAKESSKVKVGCKPSKYGPY